MQITQPSKYFQQHLTNQLYSFEAETIRVKAGSNGCEVQGLITEHDYAICASVSCSSPNPDKGVLCDIKWVKSK